MAADDIGCTLAGAAEARGYSDYLAAAAAEDAPGVHVVYINTSLRTKALAHAAVPTITCTSSNLVQTVLQARARGCLPASMCHVWCRVCQASVWRHHVAYLLAKMCLSVAQGVPGAGVMAPRGVPWLRLAHVHCQQVALPHCTHAQALHDSPGGRCRRLRKCRMCACTTARTRTWAATWPRCWRRLRGCPTSRCVHGMWCCMGSAWLVVLRGKGCCMGCCMASGAAREVQVSEPG